jgi:hypothetical protein
MVDHTVFVPADHVPAWVKPATVYFGTQPQEANATTDYTPGTMTEKAALLGVAMAVDITEPAGTIGPSEPYPETPGP